MHVLIFLYLRLFNAIEHVSRGKAHSKYSSSSSSSSSSNDKCINGA